MSVQEANLLPREAYRGATSPEDPSSSFLCGAATCRKVVEAGNKLGERALSTEVLRPRSGKKLGAEYVLVAQLR